MKLKESIIKHLQDKGTYEPDVDNYLIDMLLQDMEFMKEVKKDLDDNGCVIEVQSGNGFMTTRMNPAFNIYQMCLRNIHQTASKLGINRADRLKLKLLDLKLKDEFDKDFS